MQDTLNASMFFFRLREYNIENEQWEAEDDTLDPLPDGVGVDLFIEKGSVYAHEHRKGDIYKYVNPGGDPAWVKVAGARVTFFSGQTFSYTMAYHRLL